MLDEIFEAQQKLMEKYHEIESANGAVAIGPNGWGQLNDRQVQIRIKDLMQRTIEELMEAANELKNRPWKQTERPTDEQAFYEEIADSFHFFVELCITAGISASGLHELYFHKNAKNQLRQNEGY